MNKFYVTTPIYYVNDKPHIGHAYTTILADVLANYHRLLKTPTFFLTGTDEHGQKVQQAAQKNKITPKKQCDETVIRFQQLWEKLGINNDDFIRTTQPRHTKIVQKVLQELFQKDLIYKAQYKGYYCVSSERFYTQKDLIDGNKSPDSGKEVQEIVETNYFFKMSKYQDWLIQYINEHPDFIQPKHRMNETLGFLRQPLGDLCISRPKARLSWGIELPFDKDYVCYVWFDALLNYITAIGFGNDEELFKKWWPASCQLIGKDILTTHTVYWPTMLKAIGLEMPKSIFAHGWWLTGKEKMSKSLGNVVNPMLMCDKYGVDAFRYFLLAEMTLGLDASFTEEQFISRYNSDLANDLGNMLNRVNKLIFKFFDGILPKVNIPDAEPEKELKTAVMLAVKNMKNSISDMRLDHGLASVMNAVRAGNRYIEKTAPWKLENEKNSLALVLYTAADALRIISGLFYPLIPNKMKEMRLALGVQEKDIIPNIQNLEKWNILKSGSKLANINSLFPRVNVKKSTNKIEKSQKKQKIKNVIEIIDIDFFSKVSLKTAKVIKAETIEGADRLLKLQLELGTETRQIVAGIALYYKPEELMGKIIVVVSNLKPANIRNVESNGMLLAAKTKKELKLITVDGGDFKTGVAVG